MMDDRKFDRPDLPVVDTVGASPTPAPAPDTGTPGAGPIADGGAEPAPQADTPSEPQASAPAEVSPAVEKFRSCRWRATPDQGEFCTHRDVLPFAGKEGFSPESWCPECSFYKLRRTPKKRERVDYTY